MASALLLLPLPPPAAEGLELVCRNRPVRVGPAVGVPGSGVRPGGMAWPGAPLAGADRLGLPPGRPVPPGREIRGLDGVLDLLRLVGLVRLHRQDLDRTKGALKGSQRRGQVLVEVLAERLVG